MRLSMLRWRVYLLVGGVMSLLLLTVAATWLSTHQTWAHLVAIPAASLAVLGGALVIVTFGRWVDSTWERIVRENRSAEHRVRLCEADRIAQSLGSTTVRDLFGISLALQSAAARHPSAAPALRAVTADMDRVLREIRSHVFEGDRTIADVLTDLDPELVAAPRLEGEVDVPAPETCEAFLRDVLPQFQSAVRIEVATTGGVLCVHITGNAPDDPTTLKETAADHGAMTNYEPDHVTVEWSSPL